MGGLFTVCIDRDAEHAPGANGEGHTGYAGTEGEEDGAAGKAWNAVALEMAESGVAEAGEDTVAEEGQQDTADRGPGGVLALDEHAELHRMLDEENELLGKYLKLGGLPERTVLRQKLLATALASLASDWDIAKFEAEAEAPVQPPLPVFKNDTQRKEWLREYKDWGIWYRDENIGVEYYKYDFDNGAKLVAEVYQEAGTKLYGAYESSFLHLIGGPEPPVGKYGMRKWERHKKYSKHPDSETALVEFLKEAQRNG